MNSGSGSCTYRTVVQFYMKQDVIQTGVHSLSKSGCWCSLDMNCRKHNFVPRNAFVATAFVLETLQQHLPFVGLTGYRIQDTGSAELKTTSELHSIVKLSLRSSLFRFNTKQIKHPFGHDSNSCLYEYRRSLFRTNAYIDIILS